MSNEEKAIEPVNVENVDVENVDTGSVDAEKDGVIEVEAKEKESIPSKDEDRDSFSVFVTEDDTVNIIVSCYKKDGNLMVKNVDNEYDEKETPKNISVIFKRPSQSDALLISRQASIDTVSEEVAISNLTIMEYARIMVLIRKWDLAEVINSDNLAKLDPKIIKAMIYGLRDKIALEGII